MATSNVSLAKALKVKNRQVQKVRDLQQRIETSNSYLEGSEPDFDVNNLYQQLIVETERLWQIKATINTANGPIQATIYEMAEVKGIVAFLKSLNTQKGLQVAGFMSSEPMAYASQITAQDAHERIQAFESRIDLLQDRLDEHNASTMVAIDLGE